MKTNPEALHFESLYPQRARFSEIEMLLSYVKRGNSAQVLGLPGVGRSNLLRFLAYNNAARVLHLGETYKWFHFVYMDLTEIKNRSQADVIKFMLISLSYSLSERKMEEEQKKVAGFLQEAVILTDPLILFQVLKRSIDYLSIEKELTVVFLFDRFDSFVPAVDSTFFSNLRILRNRAKYRFSCLFSIARPLEDVLEGTIFSDFYEFVVGNTVYLKLSDAVSNEFRFSYLEKIAGKKLAESTKKKLLSLTAGHGKLSRICLEVILGEDRDQENLAAFLLKKRAVMGALLEIWNALLPLEQKSIMKGEFSEESPESFLMQSGLIEQGKIAIPLFNDATAFYPQPAEEQLAFIAETNEIRLGEEVLTEKLSPSEFKLLRFLMQNANRVCEKEEIIQAVWKDSQTQEGVTDQALDQIIYRLRKKIETDPNSPVHIITVKGRGYRFTG